MIKSFRCKEKEKIYLEKQSRNFPAQLAMRAKIKLDMLDAAQNKNDLRVPPANHLEELRGDLRGYMSIRINRQYRIVFRFEDNHAYDVYIVDYH
jgi:proteic killer suppression protein